MMIIGLKHHYEPESHSFSTLLGEDQCIAHLVSSTNFVDVHLARLTRKVTGSTSFLSKYLPEDSPASQPPGHKSQGLSTHSVTHSTSHWIDVTGCASQFYDLDIDAQAHFFNRIFDEFVEPDRIEHNDPLTRSYYFYRTVLVVWPKKESFYFDLHHRFDHLLDLMEWEKVVNPLTFLREITSRPVWTKTALRICRLLNFCTHHNAKEEALKLLHLMADESIGVPSNEAAILISQVECNLIGWPDCEEVINKLLVCRSSEQLPHLATLAQALSHRNCISGFYSVSNQTWNLFLEYAKTTTDIPDQYTLSACVVLLICMEEHLKSDTPSRPEQFLSCFVNWPLVQQCQLIIDVEEHCAKSPIGRYLYLSFCRYVAVTIKPCNALLVDLVVNLFRCYLRLGSDQIDLTKIFVESLCGSVRGSSQNNHLLEKVVASLDFLNLPDYIAHQLVDARINELESLDRPKLTWEQRDAKFPDGHKYPSVVAFLNSADKCKSLELNFVNLQDARNFVAKYFGVMDECVRRGYSAIAVPTGRGKYTRCLITKTTHLHESLLNDFKIKSEELDYLRQYRNVRSKSEVSASLQERLGR